MTLLLGHALPELTPEQVGVVEEIIEWRDSWPSTKQVFKLGGLAGTGKSAIIAHLARRLPDPLVACPTGKAAHVLQNRGVNAQTIHSSIYLAYQGQFRRKSKLAAKTLIIDEASMVTSKVYRDLCSFSMPILFVGDHGQLEPVGDNPHLMRDPDRRLEEIHRQAKDNPIIRLAAAYRAGGESEVWAAMRRGWADPTGRCRLMRQSQLDESLRSVAQVIVGFNELRHKLNARIREQRGLRGFPSPGEKLVCLQNNARFGLFNGQECVVTDVVGERCGIIELELQIEDGRLITVPCLTRQFGANAIPNYRDPSIVLMDFGYVLTVHKAQGSAWQDVLVVESIPWKCDHRRWRYTAVTRAIERILYFQ
jgi:exodeoxyribonuclease V